MTATTADGTRVPLSTLLARRALPRRADYAGLAREMESISALQGEIDAAEERWFELTEEIG